LGLGTFTFSELCARLGIQPEWVTRMSSIIGHVAKMIVARVIGIVARMIKIVARMIGIVARVIGIVARVIGIVASIIGHVARMIDCSKDCTE